MKRVLSLALALSMMFTCAGNVFAVDYGDKTFKDSDHDISFTLMMGETEESIDVPAALSMKDSDSGNATSWFYAKGSAVKKGIGEVVTPTGDYADYVDATWFADADFTNAVSFTDTDRYFNDMILYAKLGEVTKPGADVSVSEDVKNEGIAMEDISNTFPAGNTLKFDIAAVPAKTAEAVVGDLVNQNATFKAVANAVPLYLDIQLLDAQGKPIQAGQAAEITLPMPGKLQSALNNGGNAVLVIHYNADGSVKETMLASLSDDDKLTFKTGSFSTFGFIAVEKTSFEVTIENVKGGILNVTDANGVMLPVGQKVTVPGKASNEQGLFENRLYVTFASMEDAIESDLLVNGVSVGIGEDSWQEVVLSTDVVLTGVFTAAGSHQTPERYVAVVTPKLHNGGIFSGTLNFWHYKDGQKTDMANATFAFDDSASSANDNALFEISGNTLTSKAALTNPNYTVQLRVTVDDKVFTHNTSATPRVQCRITINSDAYFYVSFSRYLADQFEAWDGGWIGNASDVAKDTEFAPLAADQRNFHDVTLKDGKPQMYGYEFDRWQQYKKSDDFEQLIPVNTATVTSDLEVMAMFKGYRVNVQPLGGGGGGGGGGSTGGSGGSGVSLFGNKFAASVAQALTTAQATTATNKAIAAAKSSGSTQATIRLKNTASISPAALAAMNVALKKANMTALIYADTVVDKKIVSRMYIDPGKMTLTSNLALGVTVGNKATEAKFARSFKNEIAVIDLAQSGSFGMPVKMAVKVDLSKLNAKTLRFYNFDPKTAKYTQMQDVAYAINEDGYLFFNTLLGNNVVIADRPLVNK